MRLKPYVLTSDVARLFGVTNQRVHQLDSVLKPDRGPHGRRQFDPEIVERVFAQRNGAQK